MQFLKSSLLTAGAACLFCLSFSFNANSADAQGWGQGRALGEWQGSGQGMPELQDGMNQDQKCCPVVVHKPHTKYHEDQYKGGTVHHDRSHMVTTNTIQTTTKEEVENRTDGTTDTVSTEKKIQKKGCIPCDGNGNPL